MRPVAWLLLVVATACGDIRDSPPPGVDGGANDAAGGADAEAGNPFEGPILLDDARVEATDPATLPSAASPCRPPALVTITRVIDGDTVFANDGDTISSSVRMIGVDTPETGMGAECYGSEADAFTEQLRGRRVWLTFDRTCVDTFDRLLAYVHVGPGTQDLWERQILRRGFGRLLIIGNNDALERTLAQDEFIARRDSVGLWGACP